MFHDNLEPEEQDTFVNYSNSMKDLAAAFRVKKEHPVDKRLKSKRDNSIDKELSQLIFGVGKTMPSMKNKQINCRIIPTKLIGLSRVE